MWWNPSVCPGTTRAALEQWRSNDRKTKESTKTLYKQVLFKHLADWLDVPMTEITGEMVAQRYAKLSVVTTGSANNTFRALRMLFNWFLIRQEDLPASEQILTKNPVTVLHRRDMWQELKPHARAWALWGWGGHLFCQASLLTLPGARACMVLRKATYITACLM